MSDDEMEKFEITDYDLDNEFNIHRSRKKQSKHHQIYGIWADDSDDEDNGKSSFNSRKQPKSYTAPIGFVAGGIQQAGKKNKDNKDVKKEEDSDDNEPTTSFKTTNSSDESEDEAPRGGFGTSRFQKSQKATVTETTGEIAGLRRKNTLNPSLINKGVGNWEKHTKGIGAKLLLQMGFQPGKGLGKDLQGISAPVEAQLRKGRGAIGAYGPEKPASIPKLKQHLSGRKHLEMVRNKEERIRVERKCGIYVTGFPPNLSQKWLLAYFAKFGTVVWSYHGDSFLLLDYSEPAAASIALNRKHNIHGRNIIIKYRELKPLRAASKVYTEPIVDNFLSLIKNTSDLENQVTALSNNLQGGCSKFPVYDRICRELFGLLNYSFPMCQIFPFGSTVTGLCFKSSDLDVYIAGIKQGEESVPYLYKIRTILRRSQLFGNAIVIANAKIPILKCVHKPTGTNCDINVRNKLGVCNSMLINYYLNLDIKIRRLMLILKFWAKSHQLTGQNHLFTNYSLSLMLIFFLQEHPYRVPSVFSLQDFRCRDIQDGWNGGFSTINFFNRHLKDVPLVKLLSEFFMFYSNFEYGSGVICPYLGVRINKTNFKEPERLYDSVFLIYKKYVSIEGNLPLKVDAAICVQDPFEHSRNTTPIVSKATLNSFVTLCRLGKKLCDEGEAGLLYRLVKETPPKKIELLKNSDPDLIQFHLTMSLDTRYLEGEQGENTSNGEYAMEKAWFRSVNKFLLIVLKDFLNTEVTETTDEYSSKKEKKTDGQLDVHDKEKALYTYKCSSKWNLWNSRGKCSKNTNIGIQSGIIDTEVEVTKKLMDLMKNSTQSLNLIEFDVSLVPEFDPARILINIKKIMSHKKTFKAFGYFFPSKFSAWFETYEKELNSKK